MRAKLPERVLSERLRRPPFVCQMDDDLWPAFEADACLVQGEDGSLLVRAAEGVRDGREGMRDGRLRGRMRVRGVAWMRGVCVRMWVSDRVKCYFRYMGRE